MSLSKSLLRPKRLKSALNRILGKPEALIDSRESSDDSATTLLQRSRERRNLTLEELKSQNIFEPLSSSSKTPNSSVPFSNPPPSSYSTPMKAQSLKDNCWFTIRRRPPLMNIHRFFYRIQRSKFIAELGQQMVVDLVAMKDWLSSHIETKRGKFAMIIIFLLVLLMLSASEVRFWDVITSRAAPVRYPESKVERNSSESVKECDFDVECIRPSSASSVQSEAEFLDQPFGTSLFQTVSHMFSSRVSSPPFDHSASLRDFLSQLGENHHAEPSPSISSSIPKQLRKGKVPSKLVSKEENIRLKPGSDRRDLPKLPRKRSSRVMAADHPEQILANYHANLPKDPYQVELNARRIARIEKLRQVVHPAALPSIVHRHRISRAIEHHNGFQDGRLVRPSNNRIDNIKSSDRYGGAVQYS